MTDLSRTLPVALGALSADIVLGERLSFLHPVPVMGRAILLLEAAVRRRVPAGGLKAAGILLPASMLLLFGGGSLLLIHAVGALAGRGVSEALELYWALQLLAARSLYDHVAAVARALAAEDLPGARSALSRIVGRDTGDLSETGIARAALESLSENANDAVVAPLFFLLLGGVPLLMAYKAVSTLDSMVGYRNERYRELGWASARLDDLLAFLPARITFALMLLFLMPFVPKDASRGKEALSPSRLSRALSFRLAHPSPNSGHPIAVFAVLLGVRLGGGAVYFGQWAPKPWIGDGGDPDRETLERGLGLFRMFVFSLLVLLCGIGIAVSRWPGL